MAGELVRTTPKEIELLRPNAPAQAHELALFDDKGRKIAMLRPNEEEIAPAPPSLPFSPPMPPGGAVIQNIYMGRESEKSEVMSEIVAELSRPVVMGIWAVTLLLIYFSGLWKMSEGVAWIVVALFVVLFGTAPHARKYLLGLGAAGVIAVLVWSATHHEEKPVVPTAAPVVQPAPVVKPPEVPVKRHKGDHHAR